MSRGCKKKSMNPRWYAGVRTQGAPGDWVLARVGRLLGLGTRLPPPPPPSGPSGPT